MRVRVESMAFGGPGVGRLPSGKAVLVHGAAAGELVEARIVVERARVAEAEVEAVLEPSADRREPPCPLAGRCGGCPWMHLTPEAQRRWKGRLLGGELARAGLLERSAEPLEVEGLEGLGQRTRARLHRRGRAFGTMAARSRAVVPYEGCPALAADLDRFAREVAETLAALPAGGGDLELYVDAEGRRGLFVEADEPGPLARLPEALGIEAAKVRSPLPRREGRRPRRRGPDRADRPVPQLVEASGALSIRFEPGVFVQANRGMNARLVRRVAEAAGRGERFVEVYAGAGNLTVHLARAFARGDASEADPDAARLLRQNLEAAPARVEVRAERDERSAARLARGPTPDLLVADPPRAGMKPLAPLLASAAAPARLVMVSCHPMAAVRDLASCREAGYRLVSLAALDLFPETHHLELVAALAR